MRAWSYNDRALLVLNTCHISAQIQNLQVENKIFNTAFSKI